MRVSGATVLVTGAAGGIGSALVARLLDRGAERVYAADLDLDRLRTLEDDRVSAERLDMNYRQEYRQEEQTGRTDSRLIT